METKKLIQAIYIIIMTAYGFAMLGIAIAAFSDFQDMMDDYEYLVKNYQYDPLVSIRNAGINRCDPGEYSMFLYEFPGTQAGCDCRNSTDVNTNKSLLSGNCTADQKIKGCIDLTPISKQYLRYFDDGSRNPINICYKRLGNYSFYKQAVTSGAQNCDGKTGLKACTSGDLSKQYCVPQAADCPITNIVYSQTNPDATKYLAGDTVIINPPFNLYISRKADNLPISEMRFTEGIGVCKKNDQNNITPGKPIYALLSNKPVECKTSNIDPRFISTAQITEKTYFEVNQFDTIIQNVTDLKWQDPSYIYKQYFRNYVPWKPTARDKLKELVDLRDEMKAIRSAQTAIMIINIISCILISVILSISEVYNLCGKDVPCIEGEGDQERVRIQRIKKILAYGGKLLQCPFVIWAIVVSATTKGFLRSTADLAPSDKMNNDVITKLATEVESTVYSKDISMLSLFIVASVIDLVLLIYNCLCQSSDKVEPVKPNQNDVSLQPLNQSQHQNNSQISYSNPQQQQQHPQNFNQPQYNQPQQQPQFQQPNMYQPNQTVVVIQTGGQAPMQQPYQQQNYGYR